MSKFSIKTLLIIFLSLLIAIVILWKFVLPKQKIKASWWNDSWNYRQAINISSHTGLESNVYITTSINIGTTAKAQTDGGDFRFIDQSGQNLDYYIASGVGTTNLTFHILIPSFPSGSQTIYSYYGNTTATNGFSITDFSTQASNYTIGSISPEETGGGPIAYWKFDEGIGTTVYDSSSSQYSGTLKTGTSTPTWQNEDKCISGKCLDFNSSQNQYILSDNTIPLNGSQTYSVWVYPKSADWLMGILTTHNHANTSNLGINISTNKFSISIGYTDGTREYQNKLSNFTVPLNTWSHVELVYNTTDNSVSFYINGKYDNKWILTKTVKFIANNILVGQWSTTALNNYKFNGLVDEPKIYPYARTAAQIKLDYNSRGSSKGSSVNLGVQSSTAPSLKSSLVAYYKFDEGSGTTTNDSSPQKKSGSFAGTTLPTWSNNCKFGKCVNFISSNSNKISTNVIYDNASEYTLTGYFYPTTDGGGGQWRAIIGTQKGNNIDAALVLSGLNLCYHDYITSSDTNFCSSNNLVVLNQWQHFALSFKNNDVNIYLNGIKINNISVGKTNNPDVALIGGASTDSYSGGRFFNGLIDEVKIYNTALTEDEIKQDYNSGSAIKFGSTNQTIGGTTTSLEYCIPGDTSFCASPVAEWNFEENTGNTVKDISGNNLNGTFGTGNSAPTWSIGKNNSGSSLNLNNNGQYVKVPLGSMSNTFNTSISGKTLSFSLWFKPNNVSGTNQYLLTNNYPCNNPGNFTLSLSNKNLYFSYYSQSGGSQVTQSFIPSVTLQNNTWYHLEWTKTFGQLGVKAYLNGIPQAISGDSNLTGYGNINNIVLGAWSGTGMTCSNGVDEVPPIANMSFMGSIDQVKIYDYIRTPAQVAYDYNKGAPVGWWKLDECQGLTAFDASGLGNNGTINIGTSGTQTSIGTCNTSGTAWNNGANGKTNSSLNFDGVDDYININTSKVINPSQGSLLFWFKPSSIQNGSGYYMFAHPGSATNSRIYVYSGSNGTFVRGLLGDGTQIGLSNVTADNWHHVAIIWNGTSAKFYVDSLNKTSTPTFNGLTSVVSSSSIGSFSGGGQGYTGRIDDFRVYNYALTGEQIKQIYNGGAVNFN